MRLKIPEPTRPTMKNYGIAQDKDGLLAWTWVRQQLEAARNYWICTTRPDGRPHAAPVWGVTINDGVYFGTGATTVKARNFAYHPYVVLHSESGDDCVIIEGVIESVSDETILTQMAAAYPKKYPSFTPTLDELKANANFTVRPQVVMAWQEKDYPNTATRWNLVVGG
jgi:hypothetical protein